jgi:hypothetical protein
MDKPPFEEHFYYILFYQIRNRMSRKKWEKRKAMEKYFPLRRVWSCVWAALMFFCIKSNKRAYFKTFSVCRLSFPSELLQATIFARLINILIAALYRCVFFCQACQPKVVCDCQAQPEGGRRLMNAFSTFRIFRVCSLKQSFSVLPVNGPILTNVKCL